MARANTALIGIAVVHHVVSELSRRGLLALPTIRNTAAYDIIAMTPDGRKHWNIQVKTSSKPVVFFRMPPSTRVKAGPHDYYVLARWIPTAKHYECFLLTGRTAKREVMQEEKLQNQRLGHQRNVIVPSIAVSKRNQGKANLWRKHWEAFPPGVTLE